MDHTVTFKDSTLTVPRITTLNLNNLSYYKPFFKKKGTFVKYVFLVTPSESVPSMCVRSHLAYEEEKHQWLGLEPSGTYWVHLRKFWVCDQFSSVPHVFGALMWNAHGFNSRGNLRVLTNLYGGVEC